MKDLGTLPGDALSSAIAINDDGEIVGVSADAMFNPRAYHWKNGVMTDLNTLVPANSPLYLLLACSINSSGEITGLAVDKATGATHGYIATPIPGVFAGLNPSPARIVLSPAARKAVQRFGLSTARSVRRGSAVDFGKTGLGGIARQGYSPRMQMSFRLR